MQVRLLSAVTATLMAHAAAWAAVTTPPAIIWRDCDPALVGPGSEALGNRLQCGVFAAPLDHGAPDGRTIDVGIVRVRAIDTARREGAIFFNKGGPGAHPARLLRSLAVGWAHTVPGNARDGEKRTLAERYDLIAVIPRGLSGGWEYTCLTGLAPRFSFLPADLGQANWQRAVDEAAEIAATCATPPQAGYINTEQHVHDMDAVRRALGDDKLHFYGISYGGMAGAWYAALYPSHTGRLLLDSTIDFTHDMAAAHAASLAARQTAFLADVLAPVKKNPAAYGFGSDPVAVSDAIDVLPAAARAAWHAVLDEPVKLAAALHLAEWIRVGGIATRQAFEQRIERTRFVDDRDRQAALSRAANLLALIYTQTRPATPIFAMGPDGDSVRQAVACNDARWPLTPAQVLAMAVRQAAAYLTYDGDDILDQLVCTRWPLPGAHVPNLEPLARAPAFLLVQAENDVVTPIAGAWEIHRRFANARLLVAKGVANHGLFNFTTSRCIEGKAAHYLLTGDIAMDETRTAACRGDFDSPLSELPAFHVPQRVELAPAVTVEPPGTAVPHDEF